MGKQNFESFYKQIKSKMLSDFGKVTGKISLYGDKFEPGKNYAGVIIYAIDGNFTWQNASGRASGQRGRSLYVIIQCTDNWPEEARTRARGSGMVHDYLIKNVLGIDHDQEVNGKKKICCGGFAYQEGKLKFSSIWLNQTDQMGCDSDGSKYLSDAERVLVKYCFEQYKSNGVHHVFEISDHINDQLSGYQCLQQIPPKEGYQI